MHANGCNVAMTGLVIAGLRDSSSTLKMTTNEESWFGMYVNIIILHLKYIITEYYYENMYCNILSID